MDGVSSLGRSIVRGWMDGGLKKRWNCQTSKLSCFVSSCYGRLDQGYFYNEIEFRGGKVRY